MNRSHGAAAQDARRPASGPVSSSAASSYPANYQERQILEEYTDRTIHGTPAEVAASLEELQRQTGVDEVMLVVGGYLRSAQAQTLELLADHYGMPASDAA